VKFAGGHHHRTDASSDRFLTDIARFANRIVSIFRADGDHIVAVDLSKFQQIGPFRIPWQFGSITLGLKPAQHVIFSIAVDDHFIDDTLSVQRRSFYPAGINIHVGIQHHICVGMPDRL